jgi:hypothetical protein
MILYVPRSPDDQAHEAHRREHEAADGGGDGNENHRPRQANGNHPRKQPVGHELIVASGSRTFTAALPLIELDPANALLDDPAAMAARHQQQGCLFLRAAIDPGALADVADEAAALLERWGVARRAENGVHATGAPLGSADPAELQRLPALAGLADQMAAGTDPIAPVAARAFGCPTSLWPGARLHLALPGDPERATPPHQDSAALDWIGDYRRFWIALGEIPFGDGGLGLGAGSHRYRRLRLDELLDGNWSTAAMSIGDLFAFDLNLVHCSLPPTSDRIRIALTVIGSAQWDPRPSVAAEDAGELQLGLCEQEASLAS